MSRRRYLDQSRIGHLYSKKFKRFNRCVYCGDKQQAWDHVLPLSVAAGLDIDCLQRRHRFHQGFNLVPCCNDCNTLAGAEPFLSILDKRQFIKERIKAKNRKALKFPVWSDDEMEELSDDMKAQINYSTFLKEQLELRLSHPNYVTQSCRR